MRNYIDLVEQVLPTLYHGSYKEFPDGFRLTPQSDGYVQIADATSRLLEKTLERYRPEDCVSRFKAVFMVSDPDDIDNAGGYNDIVYEVEPQGPVTKCNLAWYSRLYSLCEHEVLSREEAKAQGRDYYPDWEDAEMEEYARGYWTCAVSQDGKHDLHEYLATSALVVRDIDA